jgi:hypothetical protein
MVARLANRLTQAHRQRFVGRSAELALFRVALSRDVPDFAVLHLHGPGGIGKTTLLGKFGRLATETNRPHTSCSTAVTSTSSPLVTSPCCKSHPTCSRSEPWRLTGIFSNSIRFVLGRAASQRQ